MAAQGRGVVISFLDRAGPLTAERVARRFGLPAIGSTELATPERDTAEGTARSYSPELRLREMLDIIGRISFRTGGPWQAMVWYRGHRIPAFGGQTAEALVKAGKAAAVCDYLDGIA